jgi:hypothetical protein
MPACACPHADSGEGWGEGEYNAISTGYIPLPFVTSRQGRGNPIFYDAIKIEYRILNKEPQD